MKLATSFYRVFMPPHSVVVKFSSLCSLINLQSIPPISSLRSRLVRLAAVSLSLSHELMLAGKIVRGAIKFRAESECES